MGDFYMGRRGMRGDPGFFSFLKTVGTSLAGAIPVVGGALQKVAGLFGTGAAKKVAEEAAPIVKAAGRAIVKHPVLSAAGAAGVAAGGAAVIAHEMHKGRVVAGGGGRKRRRMRVTNPRALRRAIRRATGFARLARRVLRFTSPRAPKGRAVFKHRRAKRI